jgi:hypothetical protein
MSRLPYATSTVEVGRKDLAISQLRDEAVRLRKEAEVLKGALQDGHEREDRLKAERDAAIRENGELHGQVADLILRLPAPSSLLSRAEDIEGMAMVLFQSDREAHPDYYPCSWNELPDHLKDSYRRRARAVSRFLLKGE